MFPLTEVAQGAIISALFAATSGMLPLNTSQVALLRELPAGVGPWLIADLVLADGNLGVWKAAGMGASPSRQPDGSQALFSTTTWSGSAGGNVPVVAIAFRSAPGETEALAIVPLTPLVFLSVGQMAVIVVQFDILVQPVPANVVVVM